jgi:hypothetical protein
MQTTNSAAKWHNNRRFCEAVSEPIRVVYCGHVPHRVCRLEAGVGILQRTTYHRDPASWFRIAKKPWPELPHGNPILRKAFPPIFFFQVRVGLAT